MFNRVIPRRLFESATSGQHLTMQKIFSDDRGRQHRLLKKTAAMQSETDDRRTTGSIIQQNIQTHFLFFLIKPPLYVLTVNIQHTLFISVFLLVNIFDSL